MKDYGFIFKDDEEMKKKAKVISDLTKDVSEYLDTNLKLNFKIKEKKYIFTNGSHAHVENVTKQLGIDGLFDGAFDIVDANIIPKPKIEPYKKIIEKFDIEPSKSILKKQKI